MPNIIKTKKKIKIISMIKLMQQHVSNYLVKLDLYPIVAGGHFTMNKPSDEIGLVY